jgi:MFS family permease
MPEAGLWSPAFVYLLLVQFAYGTAFSTFFVLPKYLLNELSASASLVGNAHGVFALGAVLLIPACGHWLDRYGAKPVLSVGLVIGALSFFTFPQARTAPAVLGLRFLHGISFALVFNAGSALTIDLAPRARRAEAIGYFGTAMMITNGFGPGLAELIAQHWGWPPVFKMCAAYSLLGLIVASFISDGSPRPAHGSVARVQLSVPLIGALSACAAMGVGVGTSKTFVPAILVEDGVRAVGPYFIAFTGGALFQRLVLGWIPDRIGHLRATVIALVGYGVSLMLVGVAPAALISLVSVLIGVAHGMAYPATVALALDLAPESVRGRITAWATGGFNIGFAASSSGLAMLENQLGYRGLLLLGGSWLVLTAMLVPRAVWWRT